ncbi:MAG: hypothetical protein HKO62_06635 [Gammaproteobacteria bacterium]|nr:hypothetical protein [Gammaproteobacteria bacterium]
MSSAATSAATQLETLQTELLVAITRYGLHPDPGTAREIVAQIGALHRHPHSELFPEQRRVLAQLSRVWQLKA